MYESKIELLTNCKILEQLYKIKDIISYEQYITNNILLNERLKLKQCFKILIEDEGLYISKREIVFIANNVNIIRSIELIIFLKNKYEHKNMSPLCFMDFNEEEINSLKENIVEEYIIFFKSNIRFKTYGL